jgi:hypothetical protein
MTRKAIVSRLDVLQWIRGRRQVWPYELEDHFGFSREYTWVLLSRLKKARLVINMTRSCWELTEEGYKKIRFLEATETESGVEASRLEARAQELEKDNLQLEKERAELEGRVRKLERENLEVEEQSAQLKRENIRLKEELKVFTAPGGVRGEVFRLLKEYEGLVTAYARAPKLGVKLDQADFTGITSRLKKILELSQYLPPADRETVLRRLGLTR